MRYTYRWQAACRGAGRALAPRMAPALRAAHQCEPCLLEAATCGARHVRRQDGCSGRARRSLRPRVLRSRSTRRPRRSARRREPRGGADASASARGRAALSLSLYLWLSVSTSEIARAQCRPRNLQRIRSNGPRRTARSAAWCERARARPGAIAFADAPPGECGRSAPRPPLGRAQSRIKSGPTSVLSENEIKIKINSNKNAVCVKCARSVSRSQHTRSRPAAGESPLWLAGRATRAPD